MIAFAATAMEHHLRARRGRAPTYSAHSICGSRILTVVRATRTAESTFGRLVVDDGKLVSRLRGGAKITTGTFDKVRAYLSEHRSALSPAPGKPFAPVRVVNGSGAAADVAPAGLGSSTTDRNICCSKKSETHKVSRFD